MKSSVKERRSSSPPRAGERPLWLFLSEPGLGGLLEKELTHLDVLKPRTRLRKLNLRNYDLLVAPDVRVDAGQLSSRIALDILMCPAFGRGRIGETQIDRVAARWHEEGADGLVSSVAGQVFNRPDVMRWLKRRFAARGISFAQEPRRPVRLLIVEEAFYFGFARANSHEAPWRSREAERAGSLPPTIAAAMCFAARIEPGDVVWDPVAGTGTLLREAAALAPGAVLIGSEIDASALAIAKAGLGEGATLIAGDSTRIDPRRSDVTLTLANLPFGKQFSRRADNPRLYERLLKNALRYAAPGWRACLLTSDEAALRQAIAALGGLDLVRVAGVKVRGHEAAIWHLARA